MFWQKQGREDRIGIHTQQQIPFYPFLALSYLSLLYPLYLHNVRYSCHSVAKLNSKNLLKIQVLKDFEFSRQKLLIEFWRVNSMYFYLKLRIVFFFNFSAKIQFFLKNSFWTKINILKHCDAFLFQLWAIWATFWHRKDAYRKLRRLSKRL